jgi:hypothetical protein
MWPAQLRLWCGVAYNCGPLCMQGFELLQLQTFQVWLISADSGDMFLHVGQELHCSNAGTT